jgi:hypothetical protein
VGREEVLPSSCGVSASAAPQRFREKHCGKIHRKGERDLPQDSELERNL